MNRILVGITMLVVAFSPALAAEDQADLAALLKGFLENPNQGSFENHDRFWAEDLIYTSSNGTRFGKASIMDGIKASEGKADPVAPVIRYRGEDVDIRLYGNTAIVAFRLVGTTSTADGASVQEYFNTGTFLKRNGVWKAVAWQATKIPAEP